MNHMILRALVPLQLAYGPLLKPRAILLVLYKPNVRVVIEKTVLYIPKVPGASNIFLVSCAPQSPLIDKISQNCAVRNYLKLARLLDLVSCYWDSYRDHEQR